MAVSRRLIAGLRLRIRLLRCSMWLGRCDTCAPHRPPETLMREL